MEGTCNECVFPLNKDASEDICSTDTSLIFAAETGKLSCVKELIASGADVNAVNYYRYTALMSAVFNGHADCVAELVKAGAELNATNSGSKTALIFASGKGRVDCVKGLIAAGAELNVTDRYGYTALRSAACNGHVDCVKELVKAGVELNTADSDGHKALMDAASTGHVDCVEELVKAGAELNATNSNGFTALIEATYWGNVDCVKELVKAGADVNVMFNEDMVLVDACNSDNEAIVQLLIEGGADVYLEDADDRTALYVAVTRGHAAYNREKSKISNDSPDRVYFQFSVHTNMVFLLLKAGAHLNKTSSGLNPCTVHLLAPYSITPSIHILKMLSIAGVDVRYRDMNIEENSSLKGLTRA